MNCISYINLLHKYSYRFNRFLGHFFTLEFIVIATI